jgi:hypothetical protein
VIGERLDLLRVGTDRSRLLLQTPRELKPSDGDWIQAVLVSRLTFDLIMRHSPVTPTSQSKHLRNREKITGSVLQGASCIPPVCKMRQKGKTLFQQGATLVARKCMDSLEKPIEHSRTSTRKREERTISL